MHMTTFLSLCFVVRQGLEIGKAMGLNTDAANPFWRDRMFLEINTSAMFCTPLKKAGSLSSAT